MYRWAWPSPQTLAVLARSGENRKLVTCTCRFHPAFGSSKSWMSTEGSGTPSGTSTGLPCMCPFPSPPSSVSMSMWTSTSQPVMGSPVPRSMTVKVRSTSLFITRMSSEVSILTFTFSKEMMVAWADDISNDIRKMTVKALVAILLEPAFLIKDHLSYLVRAVHRPHGQVHLRLVLPGHEGQLEGADVQ